MEDHPADKLKRRMEEREKVRAEQGTKGRLSDDVDAFDKLFYGELRQRFDKELGEGVEEGVVVYREMQRVVKEAAGYLPTWDRQRANEVVAECLRMLDAKKGEGKKRFQFSREARSVIIDTGAKRDVSHIETHITNAARVADRVSETIHLPPAPSIFLSRLTACTVFIKPIDGSVFIDSCKSCTFIVACRQLRVHTTTHSSFYLHCASEPIIEDTTNVTFAPYLWDFPGKQALIDSTTLGGCSNKWDQVNDFKWLKSQHSPNWSILPEDQRRTFTDDAQ
eukprot:TRINITY_DN15167_c0_g1_i1.p1 TRINITY_DN15167_c0_g1~~TRINITY_DN15167_c0_g1_i1.p1  ORF type:complete len:279 (+),score=95.59 TRINITY_DN15167_c0_g1_i1:51-887(+)